MNDIWLPLVMGFLIGAVVVGGSALYIRQDVLERYSQAQTLSDSAAELLEVLAPAGMVLNPNNIIVRVTGGALASGLVDGRRLVHKKLNELVSEARNSEEIQALYVSGIFACITCAAFSGNRHYQSGIDCKCGCIYDLCKSTKR